MAETGKGVIYVDVKADFTGFVQQLRELADAIEASTDG